MRYHVFYRVTQNGIEQGTRSEIVDVDPPGMPRVGDSVAKLIDPPLISTVVKVIKVDEAMVAIEAIQQVCTRATGGCGAAEGAICDIESIIKNYKEGL